MNSAPTPSAPTRFAPARFAEVIVNVPIRRGFGRRLESPPPVEPEASPWELADGPASTATNLGGGPAAYQTFHYHVPPQLQDELQPGHLVWVPFGRQEVQGIVVRLSHRSPVPTKPVARLARARPVLTPVQLQLAFWIADYYVAPVSQAVKLFLPPGLLQKRADKPGVRAKRELEVELLLPPEAVEERLPTLGRETRQSQVLARLLDAPGGSMPLAPLREACGLRDLAPIRALEAKGLVRREGDRVHLALPKELARERLLALKGADRFRPALQALAQAGRPLWKSELARQAPASLDLLRRLERSGLVRLTEKVRYRDPLGGRTYAQTFPPPLTGEQAQVWETLRRLAFQEPAPEGKPPVFLLHGVTGSGKTEIYLRAIQETLARGRQAIVLVPEIALTPQTVARFAGRFPGRVTVIHSQLSPGERYDVWRRIRDGEVDVVVGPRSALFAPLPRLGLLVIDEEHEASYKQHAEEWGSFTVFYDARTVARRLAQLTGSPLILGSATPSLEAYHAMQQGESVLLALPRRVMGHGQVEDGRAAERRRQGSEGTGSEGPGSEDAPHPTQSPISNPQSPRPARPVLYAEMPPVEVVDMRQELRAGNRSIFSRSLQAELHATLDAGEQAILFLNRRGSNTFVMCRDCGHVERCPHCETPLTYHERANLLICHHCNRRFPIPDICPQCGSQRIKYFGAGTQRIVEMVREIAPRARILRWDADTTGRKGSHQAILERFAAHQADVLIGTQMIAKGLDLPLVTLVGVVSADVGLYLPDFRSPERTFQLLTQVAGRAGRSQRGGRVIFQSYTPEHYAIQAAAEHDYLAFYRREIAFRREQGYPPIQRLARLIYWDKNLQRAREKSQEMTEILAQRARELGVLGEGFRIMGPAPAFFARYRGFYRWQILIQAPDPGLLLRGMPIPFGWRVDVDPVSVL